MKNVNHKIKVTAIDYYDEAKEIEIKVKDALTISEEERYRIFFKMAKLFEGKDDTGRHSGKSIRKS
ncbi:MAG: hypothetical protein ABIJ15_07090 [bacterium]